VPVEKVFRFVIVDVSIEKMVYFCIKNLEKTPKN